MRQVTAHSHHSQRRSGLRSAREFSRRVVVECPSRVARSGFTLVELMIAITILLLLTLITATAVRNNLESDRVPGGARQLQSYLEGARDRAIYSTKTLNPGPRGVRFLRNPNGPKKISSIQMGTSSEIKMTNSSRCRRPSPAPINCPRARSATATSPIFPDVRSLASSFRR